MHHCINASDETEYRGVPGFPGYIAGTDGSLTSRRRLRPCYQSNGYVQYALYRRGQRHRLFGHVLVLETFVGPRPDGHVARHRNGVRDDNRLANLEWATRSWAALPRKGKLTADQVRAIRRDPRAATQIARDYNVSASVISNIRNLRSWKHLLQ